MEAKIVKDQVPERVIVTLFTIAKLLESISIF